MTVIIASGSVQSLNSPCDPGAFITVSISCMVDQNNNIQKPTIFHKVVYTVSIHLRYGRRDLKWLLYGKFIDKCVNEKWNSVDRCSYYDTINRPWWLTFPTIVIIVVVIL